MLGENVYGLYAPMFTWEVCVPFEHEPSEDYLLKQFDKEFTETLKWGEPVFWPMVSFNGPEGRKIRYLVAIVGEALGGFRKKYDRVLPKSVALYAFADKLVRNSEFDHDGNALCLFIYSGRLYILVFKEGCLCHWSEEPGYNSGFEGSDFAMRLERFRIFLKRDEFLSAVPIYTELFNLVDSRQMDFFFKKAVKDPFWKALDLDDIPKFKPAVRKIVESSFLILMIMFGLYFMLYGLPKNEFPVEKSLDSACVLDLPPEVLPSLERKVFRKAKRSNKCKALNLVLQGVVEGVVFQGKHDNQVEWFRVGDVIDGYVVASVEKNRVKLVCNGKTFVVKNEKG